jgi:hypothetical protein
MVDPPAVEALDAELTALSADTSRVAMTLMALDADPAKLALDRVAGATKARWDAATADLAAAWAAYPALSGRVDAAAAARGSGRRPNKDTAADLDAALHAPVDLAGAGVAATVLTRLDEVAAGSAGGGAAGSAGGGTAGAGLPPAALVGVLGTLLAGVSGAIGAIDQARQAVLARAAASAGALDSLRTEVDGVDDAVVAAALGQTTDAATADPLGVGAAGFDAIDEQIAALHANATSAEALRAHLSERLAEGRTTLGTLPGLLAEAREAYELAAVKVLDAADGTAPLPTDAELRELGARLAGLDALAAAGQWRDLAARRPAWSARVDALAAQLAASRDRWRGLLARRTELRGLLRSYQAKAQAFRLAEDPALTELAEAATETLRTAPCDLATAGKQVDAYAAAVRAATATRHR